MFTHINSCTFYKGYKITHTHLRQTRPDPACGRALNTTISLSRDLYRQGVIGQEDSLKKNRHYCGTRGLDLCVNLYLK